MTFQFPFLRFCKHFLLGVINQKRVNGKEMLVKGRKNVNHGDIGGNDG